MVGPTNKEYRFSYKNILGSLESLRSDYILLRVFCFYVSVMVVKITLMCLHSIREKLHLQNYITKLNVIHLN